MKFSSTRVVAGAALVAVVAGCASNPPIPTVTTPKYPTFASPDIPAQIAVIADVRERHRVAWLRLQSGDVGGARRDYTALLKLSPGFFPAETGLGYTELADRDYDDAAVFFRGVTTRSDRYLPAWLGLADAEIGAGNDVAAIAAMERVLAIDPRREAVRSRLELVRFRQVQSLIEAGQRARTARRFADAKASLEQALQLSPASTVILRELVLVATGSGNMADAETYARRVVQAEPNEAQAHAELGALLETAGKFREASAAFARAASLESRPEWRARATALREKADLAAVPAEFGNLATASAVTRAQAAAYLGIKLAVVLDAAPKRAAAPVATDVRNHWASPWILKVTQTGVMDVFPNHTFQPSTNVRRGDLAQIVSAVLSLPALSRTPEVSRWRAARPRFADLPTSHVFYRPAAVAVAAGAMTADADRFLATRPASGADLSAAVARLEQLVTR